jgi:hypothetical protein
LEFVTVKKYCKLESNGAMVSKFRQEIISNLHQSYGLSMRVVWGWIANICRSAWPQCFTSHFPSWEHADS